MGLLCYCRLQRLWLRWRSLEREHKNALVGRELPWRHGNRAKSDISGGAARGVVMVAVVIVAWIRTCVFIIQKPTENAEICRLVTSHTPVRLWDGIKIYRSFQTTWNQLRTGIDPLHSARVCDCGRSSSLRLSQTARTTLMMASSLTNGPLESVGRRALDLPSGWSLDLRVADTVGRGEPPSRCCADQVVVFTHF